MIRIVKGDMAIECETEADVKLAMAVLSEGESAFVTHALATVPNVSEALHLSDPDDDPTPLSLVRTESPDSVVGVSHISVGQRHLDVLEAVLLFPEGVTTKGISQLLGLTSTCSGQRLQRLKQDGLVERIPHHNLWRATTLARRAKLVAS